MGIVHCVAIFQFAARVFCTVRCSSAARGAHGRATLFRCGISTVAAAPGSFVESVDLVFTTRATTRGLRGGVLLRSPTVSDQQHIIQLSDSSRGQSQTKLGSHLPRSQRTRAAMPTAWWLNERFPSGPCTHRRSRIAHTSKPRVSTAQPGAGRSNHRLLRLRFVPGFRLLRCPRQAFRQLEFR